MKYFSPKDVDHLIPDLEKVFQHIENCKSRAEQLSVQTTTVSNPSAEQMVESQIAHSKVRFLMDAVQDDINHIMSLGGVTKDLEQGLVDFPGQVDGEEVWLCWKRGEKKIRFWHALDEGFSERQALHMSEPVRFH